ncbi:MAG: (4Fe-4S)-binding protein [Tannerella sp.]|jgi:uncharacterized Fe-S cluster protein YjdI|nr:(4Fe-4S)-binding protein [Tannerella sp.]
MEEKKEIVREYTNGEVTIVWQPKYCIHATFCWRESPEIFDPEKRPWVHASGISSEKIIKQVERCPSEALTYYYNDRKDEYVKKSETPAVTETQIEVTPNGPLIVTGNVKIINDKGETEIRYDTTALCRCGGTKTPPYCDGTHVEIGFKG